VHVGSEKSSVNVQIVQYMTEFEQSENVLCEHVCNWWSVEDRCEGHWSADGNLVLPYHNCSYFELVPWD